MTAKKTNRAPRRPAAKQPANKPVAPELPVETPDDNNKPAPVVMVEPLSPQVLNLVLQIIDNTDFKGSEVNQVIAVKLELARVAGARQVQPRDRK